MLRGEYFLVKICPLLVNSEENRTLILKKDRCDKYDYIAAVACGAIGGMIDIFLVGIPTDSILGKWTDKQVDRAVMVFAGKLGWTPQTQKANNVKSAISFLEKTFKVNYDQRKPGDVKNLFDIAPYTHHMMSLAHSPDIVGLFFSVLNQFTSTSSFIANGQLVTISTDTYELHGGNFLMKIMCGIANWFGHLMSDVAGSSGSHGRGTGIVMPFYEFFGVCKFGKFSTQNGLKDLSEIASQAFVQGYDFRFGLNLSIPLIVTELSIRLIWGLRQRFQYHRSIKDSIPSMRNDELRMMLLVGNGTLCIMDGLDAVIRSGGNFLLFFMRFNLIAWTRFATLVLKEVFIRVGITDELQMNIEAYKRIHEALQAYLHELEAIDIQLFQKEAAQYKKLVDIIATAKNDEELNLGLMGFYESMSIGQSWEGDFDTHMSNRNGTLVFR